MSLSTWYSDRMTTEPLELRFKIARVLLLGVGYMTMIQIIVDQFS